jgi:UPF0755 protein
MRKLISAITFLLTLAIIAGAGAGLWGLNEFRKPGPLAETRYVIVEKGTGMNGIAARLESEGAIASGMVFKIAARVKNQHTQLKAGEYEIAPQSSMAAILDKIVKGEVYDRKLTFREGLTSWQIVQMLNNATELSGEALTSIPEEGSLLPETYHYMKTDTRQNVIEQMQAAMKKAQDDLWPTRVPDLPVVNMSEVMVLASIVEKETGVPDERRKVAGVFINRLKRGMPLQSDPTAIYALTKGEIKDDGMGPLGRRLLRKDLEIDSPYNTYKYPGLPPGPICNPGRESIAAVLNPETHNYVYFVADGTGGHVFAETLAEHESNVAKWRKIRAQGQ